MSRLGVLLDAPELEQHVGAVPDRRAAPVGAGLVAAAMMDQEDRRPRLAGEPAQGRHDRLDLLRVVLVGARAENPQAVEDREVGALGLDLRPEPVQVLDDVEAVDVVGLDGVRRDARRRGSASSAARRRSRRRT